MADLKTIIRNEEIVEKDGFYITYTVPYEESISEYIENYRRCFTVLYDCELIKVSEVHSVASATASTLQILRGDSGEASNSGDSLLSTAFSLTTTADVPVIKEKTDMIRDTRFSAGQMLNMIVSGADINSLRNVQLTFYFIYTGRGNYKRNG